MFSSSYQVYFFLEYRLENDLSAFLLDELDIENESYVRFSINDSLEITPEFNYYINSLVRYCNFYAVEPLLCCICIGSVFN